jgi:hypothetical protein
MRRLPASPSARPVFRPGYDIVKEIEMFFQGKGAVHQSLRRLVKRLEKARIPHAIAGGMAVNAHGHERMTKDVDVLLTPDGFAEFQRLFVPKFYQPVPGRKRRFMDKINQRTVDILVTGLFPGLGQPGPIAFPDPTTVCERIQDVEVINLVTLIELKLAARRHQDFADVVNLIAVHNLDESFCQRLHRSVRQDFIECLEEKRREDEYIARNG